MKKLIPLILCLFLLLCGCESYTSEQGIDFPFSLEDIVRAEMFDHTALEKKITEDPSELQSLYATFHYLEMRSGPIDHSEDAHVYSFRFHLADGSTYLLIYEKNTTKGGILTGQDLAPKFTAADIAGMWDTLKGDATPIDPVEQPSLSPDEEIIQNFIQAYFDTKQQDFLSEEDISTSHFFTPLTRQNLNILPFSRVFRFEKLFRRDMLDQILEESLELTIHDIQNDGSSAAVEVTEVYTYRLVDADADSVRQTNCVISLLKVDGQWKINYIETDNPLTEGLIEGIGDVDAYFS